MSSDDAQKALERARAARDDALGHLVTVQGLSREMRRERIQNHLAADVYEAMKRR